MGVIKKGILGGFSGKIGQVVGGTWKGIDYMRSRPSSVANPRTTAQTNQRTKFKGCTQFFSLLLGNLVQIFWDGLKPGMSGYNDIVQTNVDNFNNDGTPIYADLKISKGPLQNIVVDSISANDSPMAVTINWTDNAGHGNALANDELCFVCVNTTSGERYASNTGFLRSMGSAMVAVPNLNVGDVLETYTFFVRNGNNKFASISAYNNVTVI